mmetsp:Transcript_164378/g.315736  ORF Transcript_164378/g.315736 Transcript_164378/m.315736 type:complete len:258 (-) Transcript_164378:31-804(-)
MMLRLLLAAATLKDVLAVGADGTDQCPGSSAGMRAWHKISVQANVDCDKAKAEVKGRANGEGGWQDPAIGMSTKLLAEGDQIKVERKSGAFTDHVLFSFNGTSSSCKITGCSESQGQSMADFGSNFCNSYNFMCGMEEGCCPSTMGWEYKISELTTVAKSSASSKSMSVCTGDSAGSGASGSKPVINCKWPAEDPSKTSGPNMGAETVAPTPAPTPAPAGSSGGDGGSADANSTVALNLRVTSGMALVFAIFALSSC